MNKRGYFYLVALLVSILGTSLFGQMGDVNIHGFVSQGYMWSTDNNFLAPTSDGTFEFNELGLNFSTEVSENLRVGLQFFSRDLGNFGNDEIIIDWAYADYFYNDYLGLRIGKIKKPLGLYNEIRDIDLLRTNILMPQSLYNDGYRDVRIALKGIGIYGSIETSSFGTFSYQALYGVDNLNTSSTINTVIEDAIQGDLNKYDLTPSSVVNITWDTPLDGFRLVASGNLLGFTVYGKTLNNNYWKNTTLGAAQGIAMQLGAPLPATYEEATAYIDLVNAPIKQSLNNMYNYIYSAEYTWNSLQLFAEYIFFGYESESKIGVLPVQKSRAFNAGFYGGGSYKFSNLIEVGSYYFEYYANLDDKDGKKLEASGKPASNAWLKDLAVSVKFNINPYWIVKAEGHVMDGTAIMLSSDQEDPNDVEPNWNLFLAKVTYNF